MAAAILGLVHETDPLAEARGGSAAARRLLWSAKSLVARYPSLAMPVARRREGHGVLAGPDTEILVESFPRSGNSFVVTALLLQREPRIRVAHHVHAPAHVLVAERLHIPAIVLLRDPDDAVLSTLVYRPFLTPVPAYHAYERFYRPLLGHEHAFVLAPFQEVTTDFGRTIRRVNERFGCDLPVFEHTPENEARVFSDMDEHWRYRVGEGEDMERHVGRPSSWRTERKAALAPLLSQGGARRDAAYRVYERMRALAP